MCTCVTLELRRNNSHNTMPPKRPKWTNHCAKTNRGSEKLSRSGHLLSGSYLHQVWRAGRHTQITPEVLPGEQTSDSLDSWCPAGAWTRAGPTASMQRDHGRAVQQQLMCRGASTPPRRPAHTIRNFLKYDQVDERGYESGGGGGETPPPTSTTADSTPCAPAHRRSPSRPHRAQARVRRRRRRTRSGGWRTGVAHKPQ